MARNFEKAVYDALTEAVRRPPDNYHSDVSGFRDKDDDEPILVTPHLDVPKTAVYGTDPADIGRIFEALPRVLVTQDVTYPSKSQVAQIIKHERTHGTYSQALGAQRVYYGIGFVSNRGRGLRCQPFTFNVRWQTTKLKLAAVIAGPSGWPWGPGREREYDGDLEALKALGYPGGIQQVGKLIVAHNQGRGGRKMPLPKNFHG